MRRRKNICFVFLTLNFLTITISVFSRGNEKTENDLRIWYTNPGTEWHEALPLGNGRIGALVTGGVEQERIILNEATLYSGVPHDYESLPDHTRHLKIIETMIRNGDYTDADAYGSKHLTGQASPCYQPLGDLLFDFSGNGKYSNYSRELDLAEAVSKTYYQQDGTNFSREIFISYPDDAMIICMKSDKKGALNFSMSMESKHPTLHSMPSDNKEYVYSGQVPGFVLRRTLEWVEERKQQWKYPEIWEKDGKRKPGASAILYNGKGIKFEVRIRVLSCDGNVSADARGLNIQKAKEVVLAVAVASSFNGYDKDPVTEGVDPADKTREVITKVSTKNYKQLLNNHLSDYKNLFDRVSIQMESEDGQKFKPNDERKKDNAIKIDPSLAAMHFQYGRYLLIASSRPGGQPVNLQGLWNVDIIPPWGSNYTTNINTQMNYWLAGTTNLNECQETLFDLIKDVSVTGSKVASDMYKLPGWVLHHNTSLWRGAHPVDIDAPTSFWPAAGGWFCQHLWEHYLFTMDEDFLRYTAYPLMKGSAAFFDAWLVPNENGRLVTPISTSPENQFLYIDEHGWTQSAGMSAGSTMDMAIIRELFRNTIAAGKLLNQDAEFCAQLGDKIPRLLPYQIGSYGQLLEFSKEFIEGPPRHNTSPYYPLYPGTEFTLRKTPELTEAVKTLIIKRGRTGGGGWPGAWHAALWARLKEGEHCLPFINGMIDRTFINMFSGGGTTYQIDANLGFTAAVVEMLLQSHEGEIELLPALPKAWTSGSVMGLRARGGFEINMKWEKGELAWAALKSSTDTNVVIRLGNNTVAFPIKKGETIAFNNQLKKVTK
jgi:alpha-L-fucosidase 2